MKNSVLFPILTKTGSVIMKIDPVSISHDLNQTIEQTTKVIDDKTKEMVDEKAKEVTEKVNKQIKEQFQANQKEIENRLTGDE
jgi:membrane protein required for colicin V production